MNLKETFQIDEFIDYFFENINLCLHHHEGWLIYLPPNLFDESEAGWTMYMKNIAGFMGDRIYTTYV